jgi:hypothetical protein
VSNLFPAILEKITSSRLSASHATIHCSKASLPAPPAANTDEHLGAFVYRAPIAGFILLVRLDGSVCAERVTDSIGIFESQLGVPPFAKWGRPAHVRRPTLYYRPKNH